MSNNKILPGLNLTVITLLAMVCVVTIQGAGHIHVKPCFQVKRNRKRYRCVYLLLILFLWV